MKITHALIKSTQQLLTTEEAERLNEDGDWRHDLVCVHCGCPLSFTPRSDSHRSFFKTRNRQNHAEDCEDFFRREERQTLVSKGEVVEGRFNEKSLKSHLKRMDAQLKNPEKDRDKAIAAGPARPKNKTGEVTTPKTKRKQVRRVKPTTDLSMPVLSGENYSYMQAPPRTVDVIGRRSLNRVFTLGGLLTKVRVGQSNDPQATLTITYNHRDLVLRVRPDVFQMQIGLFDRLVALATRLSEQQVMPRISVVAEIQTSISGNLEAVLLDEKAMMLNGELLSVYLGRH
jgi:hypothetical protein